MTLRLTLGYRLRLMPALTTCWLLPQVPVHQILDELDAPEFQHLRVRLDAPVERHAHLPGPRKHLRILDRDLVVQRLGAARREALHHVQRVAVEIARPVEPAQIVEALRVDDQVSPSQRPFDQPIQLSAGASVWSVM